MGIFQADVLFRFFSCDCTPNARRGCQSWRRTAALPVRLCGGRDACADSPGITQPSATGSLMVFVYSCIGLEKLGVRKPVLGGSCPGWLIRVNSWISGSWFVSWLSTGESARMINLPFCATFQGWLGDNGAWRKTEKAQGDNEIVVFIEVVKVSDALVSQKLNEFLLSFTKWKFRKVI